MTGWRLTSSIPAMMRSLSSCLDVTRMWRRTERANLEKKPSMRLSQEPCLGVKVNWKRPSVGRIGGIEKLEEFDELSAAVAVSDQGMDLAGEQINSGQQAERAMAFILMITREGRMHAGLRRQIRCRRCDRLDSWLFVAGDDRHWLARFLRFGGLFQDLHLAINAQHLRHL